MKYIKHLPLALFTSFCLKYLVFSISYTDIMLLAVLAASAAFFEYKLFTKEFLDFKARFDKSEIELKEVKQSLIGMQNTLNSNLNSIKIGQTLRGTKIG